jgi:hypothetical protein
MRGMLKLLGALALLLTAAACNGVVGVTVGSGNVKTESRAVSGFSAVTFAGVGDMTITQTGAESLSISAEDNILPLITTDVSGGTLRIGLRPGMVPRPTRAIHYTVTVKRLDAVTLSGAGTITGSALATDALRVTLSGAGKMTLAGTATQQQVQLSGAGDYDGSGLQSNTARVTVSGLGSARVYVRDSLDATVSGAGSVVYFGSPTVTQHVSGTGAVKKG